MKGEKSQIPEREWHGWSYVYRGTSAFLRLYHCGKGADWKASQNQILEGVSLHSHLDFILAALSREFSVMMQNVLFSAV